MFCSCSVPACAMNAFTKIPLFVEYCSSSTFTYASVRSIIHRARRSRNNKLNGLPAQTRAFGLSIRVINPLYLLFHLVYQKSRVPDTHPKLWSLQPFFSHTHNLINMIEVLLIKYGCVPGKRTTRI